MRKGNIFWGLILIAGGAILLLNGMGLFQNINIWDILWPTFLILLGGWFLLGRFFGKVGSSQDAEIKLDGATRGQVTIKHGAGHLKVYASNDEDKLVKGEFGGGVDINTRHLGDLLDTTLSIPPQSIPWFGGGSLSLDWNVSLNPQIPLSLEFNTGAGENTIDLTDLQVEEIRLQTGASSSAIKVPTNAGFTRLFVESGVASVNIYVPESVAARISTSGGLASFNIDTQRFPRVGNTNQSINYDNATNKVDIDIQTGVGSVDVR